MEGKKPGFADKIRDLVTPTLLAIAWWSIQTEIMELKTEVKEIRKLASKIEFLEEKTENHQEDLQQLEKYFFVKPEDIRVPGTRKKR